MLFIGGGVPKFELLDTPAREFSKTWNLVSTQDSDRATGKKIINEIRHTEGVYRATSRSLLKEIRREFF